MATKKSGSKTTKRSSGTGSKRTLIAPNDDNGYIRRDEKGRIKESDDQGKSLGQDVRKSAKKTVPAGQGDRGDQKRKS